MRYGALTFSVCVLLLVSCTETREPAGPDDDEPVSDLLPDPELDIARGVIRNELVVQFHRHVGLERATHLADSLAAELEAVAVRMQVGGAFRYQLRWNHRADLEADDIVPGLGALAEVRRARSGAFLVPLHEAPSDNGWPGYPGGPHGPEIFWHWAGDRRTEGSNWGQKTVNLPLAWGCQTEAGGPVGVVDIGFTPTGSPHSDLGRAKIYRAAWDTAGFGRTVFEGAIESEEEHGLHVAGVLAARGDNASGLTGVVWEAPENQLGLYQGRYFYSGSTMLVDVEDALLMVNAALEDGARLLNLSLGFPGASRGRADTLAAELADIFVYHDSLGHDFLAVIAAGNAGREAADEAYPQLRDTDVFSKGDERVLVVGAADRELTRWEQEMNGSSYGSNHGALVELYAPGSEIETLSRDAGTVGVSGTSLAAPFVSGAAALLWGFDETLTAAEVRNFLLEGAALGGDSVPNPDMSRRTPVLDVYESMKLIAADRTDTPPCGMFAWESNDQVDFWALTRAGSEVSVSLAREYPVSPEQSYPQDVGHDHRSLLISQGTVSGETLTLFEYNLLAGGLREIVSVSRTGENWHDDWQPVDGRLMPHGGVVETEAFLTVVDTAWPADTTLPPSLDFEVYLRLVEYPSRNVLADSSLNSALSIPNPFAVSHDQGFYAYIDGERENHAVYVTDLSQAGGSGTLVLGGGSWPDGIWYDDVVMSPRGDAIAVKAANGRAWEDNHVIILSFESTVYETRSVHTEHRVEFENTTHIARMRFTPDGEGLLLQTEDFDRDVCTLHYVAYRDDTASLTALPDRSCYVQLMNTPAGRAERRLRGSSFR